MSKRTQRVGLVLVIAVLAISAIACANQKATWTVEEALEGQFGGEVEALSSSDVAPVKDGDEPDSHQIMAMMILQGAGYDSDLSSYQTVELVPTRLPDGREVNIVVLDGEDVVYPASLTD